MVERIHTSPPNGEISTCFRHEISNINSSSDEIPDNSWYISQSRVEHYTLKSVDVLEPNLTGEPLLT